MALATPKAPVARDDDAIERAVAAIDHRARWAIALLALAGAALLLYQGRDLTFFYDEWNFVTEDYGGGIHSLLAAHNGNIIIFPVAIYKVLFHLAGLNHYFVYRLVLTALHVACGVLAYVFAQRRIGRVPALLAAALILFLGAAWEDTLWPFQIGYLLSVSGGLAVWILLDRPTRRGDLLALACMLVSVGSSSIGVAVLIGVAVELALTRRWRAAWIVVVPAVLYALWNSRYGESQITVENLLHTPGYVAEIAASGFGGLFGKALEWGRPLGLLGLVLLLRRLVRPAPSARLIGLVCAALGLWAITGAARAGLGAPESSRYVYMSATLIVLIGVELLSEVRISARATAVGAAVVLYAVLGGLAILHAGAGGLRETSAILKAELGAMEIDRALAPPAYHPDPQRAPTLAAGPYFHVVSAIGSSPADSPADIEASDAAARAAADVVFVQLGAVRLIGAGTQAQSEVAPAPTALSVVSGNAVQRTGCLVITPQANAHLVADLALPAGGVVIRFNSRPAPAVDVRRFGESWNPLPSPASVAKWELITARDDAPVPWQLQLSTAAPAEVCGAQP